MNDEQFETLQELLSGIYVQLARIYDVLTITLDKLGGNAIELHQEHASGHILGPPPLLIESDENADTNQNINGNDNN